MLINTPISRNSYLIWGILLYLSIPFVVALNTYINLRLEMYNPEADSISIPIFQSIFTTLLLSPVFAAYLYFGARKYKGGISIFSWQGNKSYYLGLLATIIPAMFAFIVIIELTYTLHLIMSIHWVLILHFIMFTKVSLSEKVA